MDNLNEAPNWQLIRTEYVCGNDSIAALARKYRVNVATLESRAARDKWASERKRLQSNAQAIAEAEIIKDMAGEIRRCNVLDLSIAMMAKRQIRRHLEAGEAPKPALDEVRIGRLMTAASDAQRIAAIAIGKHLPTGESNAQVRTTLDDLENATDDELDRIEAAASLMDELNRRGAQ